MKIIHRAKLIVFLAIGLIISGCATLDKNECQTANWETIGYEDGTHGYPASRIGKHRSACAKHGIAPDLALYTKGRTQGLTQYCRADVGYREGVKGKTYQNVCPAASEKKFMAGYHYGQRLHQANSRIHRYEHKITKQESFLEELSVTLGETEAELVKDGVSHKRREHLLDELKHLSARQHESEELIEKLSHRLDDARHRLQRLQANNPYEY